MDSDSNVYPEFFRHEHSRKRPILREKGHVLLTLGRSRADGNQIISMECSANDLDERERQEMMDAIANAGIVFNRETGGVEGYGQHVSHYIPSDANPSDEIMFVEVYDVFRLIAAVVFHNSIQHEIKAEAETLDQKHDKAVKEEMPKLQLNCTV